MRFNDFVDERRISSAALRGKAQGLMEEVSEASATVEDVRTLGERPLWYAGRYPYLLGEQTELTAYRIFDQPEILQLIEASKSAQRLSDAFALRIETSESILKEQQKIFSLNFQPSVASRSTISVTGLRMNGPCSWTTSPPVNMNCSR